MYGKYELYTVEGRYNVVHYNMMLHVLLQRKMQNLNQNLDTQKLYPALTGKLWGVFCEDFREN